MCVFFVQGMALFVQGKECVQSGRFEFAMHGSFVQSRGGFSPQGVASINRYGSVSFSPSLAATCVKTRHPPAFLRTDPFILPF